TFSGNKATTAGGAIDRKAPGAVKVKGSILAASTPGNCGGTITDKGYNISDDSSCAFSATGSQNSVSNVGLDTNGLQSNGGPTQTIALLAVSPAIDAIASAACTDQASSPKALTTDQRGYARPDP